MHRYFTAQNWLNKIQNEKLWTEESTSIIHSYTKDILKKIVPLFYLFIVADYFYLDFNLDHTITFGLIRLATLPCALVLGFFILRTHKNLNNLNFLLFMFVSSFLIGIYSMLLFVADDTYYYFTGVLLTYIAAMSLIPWTKVIYPRLIFPIVLLTGLSFITYLDFNLNAAVVMLFFTFLAIFVAFVAFEARFRVRINEFNARVTRDQELEIRAYIIEEKTKENTKLALLSKQFSPQVIEYLNKSDEAALQPTKTELGVFFVDIVNSTKLITKTDIDEFNEIISNFIKKASKILMANDITIDKFTGDGFVGFANAPIKNEDYPYNLLKASWEMIELFKKEKGNFQLDLRVGLAIGEALVGFFGDSKTNHHYTVIGPIVNLSARLCSEAPTNGILINKTMYNMLQNEPFVTFGEHSDLELKGFSSKVRSYVVTDVKLL